jgi:hypothetical protein
MAAATFVALKAKGITAEYVQEIAKDMVRAKQFSRLDNQHYVSTKQYERLKPLNGVLDFIVTDGPLAHGLYYNLFNPSNTSDKSKTAEAIHKYLREFVNVNIFLQRGDFKYETEGRMQTEDEAKIIDMGLQHVLHQHGIDFQIVESNISDETIEHPCSCLISAAFDFLSLTWAGEICFSNGGARSLMTRSKASQHLFKKRPDWLGGLELDGYNEELELAFEYQGLQHFECRSFFFKTEEEFKAQQERDRRKYELCRQRGVCLLLVPYKFTHREPEAMKTFIVDQLVTLGFMLIIKGNKPSQ